MSAVVRDISPIRRRARSHEPTMPQIRAATRNMERVLREMGFTEVPVQDRFIGHKYRAETSAGPYHFSLAAPAEGQTRASYISAGITVYGVFEFPERARDLGIDCNPYSGKWNHHFLTRGIIDDAHEEFRRQISRYLIREPKNDLSP